MFSLKLDSFVLQAYLMVLSDILQLAESPEYSSHPKQQPGELVGFNVPEWMIEKMKAYIETAKTNPDTTDDELLRIAEEYAEMEEDSKSKKVCLHITELGLISFCSSRVQSGERTLTSAWTGPRIVLATLIARHLRMLLSYCRI